MLDYMAYLIIALTWLFGGAAIIDDGSGYKIALKQWSGVTAFIGAAVIIVCAVAWAVFRLTGEVT